MGPNRIAILRLVELELAVAALYHLFAERYIEDREFWSGLKDEEIQHARILKQIGIEQNGSTDDDSIASTVSGDVLDIMIKQIRALLHDVDNQRLSRKEVCFIALQLEQSAGEFHYHAVTSAFNKTQDHDCLNQLFQDDQDHVNRIRQYLHQVFNEKY